MCFVSAVSGMCIVMKSACGMMSSSDSIELHLQRARAARREIRIVSQHAHAKGDGAPRDLRADAAHAEDGERLVVKLDAFEVLPVPLAGLHARIGLRDVARRRDHQREGVLRGRDRVPARRVHHDDAALRRRIHIHVIHAHARAADDLQLLRGLDELRRRLGLAAHHERGYSPMISSSSSSFSPVFDGDIEQPACGEFSDAALGDGIGDENFGFGHGLGKRERDSPQRRRKAQTKRAFGADSGNRPRDLGFTELT